MTRGRDTEQPTPERDMEVCISLPDGQTIARQRLTRVLNTIGSDAHADVRVSAVPARWALLRRDGETFELRLLGTGKSLTLGSDRPMRVDGVELTVRPCDDPETEAGLPIRELAESLASVQAPDDALRLLLRGLIAATKADSGAVVLREPDGFVVSAAEQEDGAALPGAHELLSDTVIHDVLASGQKLRVEDLEADARYANVPSVMSLRLRSVLCTPLLLGGKVLGALYLGRRRLRLAFSERHAADLMVLATMAVPLLIQLRRLRDRDRRGPVMDLVVGECPAMQEVQQLVARVAPTELGVLLQGETGTGKGVVARAIHEASPRAGRPMMALNCAAVPEGLLASELFGARKGAFTGSVADRRGLVEAADGSTLFLDEVGDMPLTMQAALLRVLEDKTVTRIGDTEPRPVDFRLVAATNRDLDVEVRAGRFRQDLLYRLREFPLELPPLRVRGEDILLMAHLFLPQAERQLGLPSHSLTQPTQHRLTTHPWPGNVRELRAVMRRAAILAEGPSIRPEDLRIDAPLVRPEAPERLDLPLAQAREAFEARYIKAVLEHHQGNREAAAAALGISVRTLYRHLP